MKTWIICFAVALPLVLANMNDRNLENRRKLQELKFKLQNILNKRNSSSNIELNLLSDDSREVTAESVTKERSSSEEEAAKRRKVVKPEKKVEVTLEEDDGPSQNNVPWPLDKAPTIYVVSYETLKLKNKANKYVYVPNVEADKVIQWLQLADRYAKNKRS